MSVSIIWLLVGAGLIALEVLTVPGLGFIFAGLAAIITGAAIEFGMVEAENAVLQGAVFLVFTSVFAALLWKKLKTWRLNPKAPQYSNIVGTEAVVTKTLVPGEHGEVQWSGTLMRARLAAGEERTAVDGTTVVVTETEGNLLVVKMK